MGALVVAARHPQPCLGGPVLNRGRVLLVKDAVVVGLTQQRQGRQNRLKGEASLGKAGRHNDGLPVVHMQRPGGPYGVQCKRRGESRLTRSPTCAESRPQNAGLECPTKEAALVWIALEGLAQEIAVPYWRGFKAGYEAFGVRPTHLKGLYLAFFLDPPSGNTLEHFADLSVFAVECVVSGRMLGHTIGSNAHNFGPSIRLSIPTTTQLDAVDTV